MNRLPPVSPGELLLGEFIEPLGISQYRLARAIGVAASCISEIIAGQRAITADTDLRLCRVLRLSPGYWLRAQVAYDTELAAARPNLKKLLLAPEARTDALVPAWGQGRRRGWRRFRG